MIEELSTEFDERGVTFRVAEATGSVRDALRKAGVADKVAPLDQETTVERIVEEWQAGKP